MAAYYNEIDPAAAHILECLVRNRVIADGVVDRRSIVDINPRDLDGFAQCHFFAGGGLWSVALRLAGVPDDYKVWTGSCPCQPLSVAGKQKGADDERHLWPAFHRLIAEHKPPIVFGEQVSGKSGFEWLAGVRADLEESGYACGAADLPACSVGAPQIRKRLYWCAVANPGREQIHEEFQGPERGWREWNPDDPCRRGMDHWKGAEWLVGTDGKSRRAKPGIRLLVDGVPGRTNLFRLAGNAIVPQLGAVFIRSALEAINGK